MDFKPFQLLKKHTLLVPLLVLISILIYANYTPDTFLTGWDTLHPEFNFSLYWNRIIDGVWQEHQGLGTVATQAHAAEIPRILILMLISLFSNMSAIRYIYAFLMLILGPVGVYFFLKKTLPNNTDKLLLEIASFLGSLFYLLNLSTLQHFYVPLEMFLTQFGLIGWLFLTAVIYFESKKKKHLIQFLIISLFSTPQAHTATLFYAYFLGLVLYLGTLVIQEKFSRISIKKYLTLIGLTLLVNSFWILPNMYFVAKHGGDIGKSKIHRLFSQEAFIQNENFGNLEDVTIFRSFLFNWGEHVGQGEYGELLGEWKAHHYKPFVLYIGYTLFGLSIIGLILGVLKKEKYVLPILTVFLIAFFFIMTTAPPFGLLFRFFQDHVPLFKEAFRFPFTKFSTLLAFSVSVFFSYFISLGFSIFKKRVNWVFLGVAIAVGLVYYMYPAFQGNLVSPSMKVAIPDRYFEMFEYFDSQHEYGRVADFPIHSFWGWTYYNWDERTELGYQGAGFLWFGIKQPLLNREFDRWGLKNEQYYREMSTAVYQKDLNMIELLLEKYQVRWLILDKSIVSPGAEDSVLFYPELENLFRESSKIEISEDFGAGLLVYKVTPNLTYSNKSIIKDFAYVDKAFFKDPSDPIISKLGTYVYKEVENSTHFPFLGKVDLDEEIMISGDLDGLYFGGALENIELFYNSDRAFVKLVSRETDEGFKLSLEDAFHNATFREVVSYNIAQPIDEPVFLKVGYKIIKRNRSETTSGLVSTIDTKNINKNEKVLVSQYKLGNEISKGNKIEYASVLENCGIPGAGSSYEINRIEEGFELRAVGVKACITAPLSEFLEVSEGREVVIGTSFTFVPNGAVPDFCLLDSEKGICINKDYIDHESGTYDSYFVFDSANISRYFIRYFVNGSTGSAGVSYKDINWFYLNEVDSFEFDVSETVSDSSSFVSETSNLFYERVGTTTLQNISAKNNPVYCDTGEAATVSVSEDGSVKYISEGESICDSILFRELQHSQGYVLEVGAENIKGLPLRLCLTNEDTKRCDIYVSLEEGVSKIHKFMVPPSSKGTGYTVNVTNLAFGDSTAVNSLSYVSFIPIPYDFIKGIHTAPIYSESESLLLYGEAYEDGWIALCGWKICNADHVLVNNWANGWVFAGTVPQNVKLVFWPQLLQYAGFVGLIGVFFTIMMRKSPNKPSGPIG